VPPTQLDPTEQDALVKQIGLALLRAAPENWDSVLVDFRAVGRYSEADGEVIFADEGVSGWQVPPDITALFTKLRAGMYRDGRGTWFNAKYRLDHPSSYNLDYDREEPAWRTPPPPQAYADDLQAFPRSDENIPEWLLRRVSSRPEPPRFRVARIFDGEGPHGRPMVNRPTVPEAERGDLLAYLGGAPLVMPARGFDADRLDPDGRPVVPIAFHTDGTWIWPAAVGYYLHNYGISPELELVGHIRRQGGKVPEVDEGLRGAAAAFLSRGAPGPVPPGQPPAGGMLPPQGPPPPGGVPPVVPPAVPHVNGRPALPAVPPPVRPPEPTMAVPRPPVAPPPEVAAQARPAVSPPAAALPSQGPPSATIDTLRSRLNALGVPASAYRIGPPEDRAWTMDQTPEGWRVGWYDRDFVAPAMFEDVADAAAFLLGKIMLDNGRRAAPQPPPEPEPAPEPPAPPAAPEPGVDESTVVAEPVELFTAHTPAAALPAPLPPAQPAPPPFTPPPPSFAPAASSFAPPPAALPTAPQPAHAAPQPAHAAPQPTLMAPPAAPVTPQPTLAAPVTPQPTLAAPVMAPEPEPRAEPAAEEPRRGTTAQSGQPQQRWPIQPRPGEPPLTLFRGKRLVELAPGTEVDRFGNPDGNLTYAVGTPFTERSLVPDWVERPYHTYRVEAPLQVLSGTAIPWFEQVGGGTAYILPASIDELISDGKMVEVLSRKPPV
jgi:hypothetical protein